MPCYDGRDEEDRREADDRTRKIEAMLCAASRYIESISVMKFFLNRTDWNEVGVTKDDYINWWNIHKAEDSKRKAR